MPGDATSNELPGCEGNADMTLVLRTTKLNRHKGSDLSYGYSELLTLAPGQVTSPGSLVLADDTGPLPKADSIAFRIDPPGGVEVRLGNRQTAGYEVTIRAKALGKAIIYVGKTPVGAVTVGVHASHLGVRAVDLLARVSNGPDARKIVAIQQILQNQVKAIINQFTGAYGVDDRLVCGSVAQQAGTSLFGSVVHGDRSYHKKIGSPGPSPMDWSDIQYDPQVTQGAIARIRAHLDQGSAVRLGMVYSPAWSMLAPNRAIQAERSGGHTILVVGYVDDQFLYLDSFPLGSRVKYVGGLPFNSRQTADYLGVLGVSAERGMHLVAITNKPLKPKFLQMDVISGP
jgi:hypothetical protein